VATAADDNDDSNGDEHNSDTDADGDWKNWKYRATVWSRSAAITCNALMTMNTISCTCGLQTAKFKIHDDDADDDDGYWRRSVVKSGGSGSASSSHQTVSNYTLHQWFPNKQQSRILTACRRREKLVLPSIFEHKSFTPDDVKLAELYNISFEW